MNKPYIIAHPHLINFIYKFNYFNSMLHYSFLRYSTTLCTLILKKVNLLSFYMVTRILNIIFGKICFHSLTITSHKILYFAVKTHRYVNSFNFYEIIYLSESEKSFFYFQCRNFYCSWIIFCRNMPCLSKLSVIRGALLLIAKSERRRYMVEKI